MSNSLTTLLDTIVARSTRNSWELTVMQRWPAMVGKLSERMCVQKINGSTLVIGVYDVHWMQELFMLSSMIIAMVNRHLGAPQVENLRFVSAEKQMKLRKRDRKRPARAPVVQQRLLHEQESALSKITDELLKQELRRLMVYRRVTL